jgi:DNA-binding IclR family transcriptional regulator
MVLEHLAAHPEEAFTSTRISRAIGRSSGAIANALVTLTRQGLAEQVTVRPMAYRLAEGNLGA